MTQAVEHCPDCQAEYLPRASPGGVCPRCLLGIGLGVGEEQRIGPYRILDTLGEGGMGVVYLAEQEAPLRRQVALKLIKPGMDTGQVIARFESERQALALMDHVNVARVFDAGTSELGRPYFVMEYIRGEPITAHCDRHRLDLRSRLELFIQACDAIQHAHRKGVIHRDVKPNNVLVATGDGAAQVKVIDFGVAKATTERLTERTLNTRHGVLIGTPAYMSPEQAEVGGAGVDTRTDVYSLGVLLYELIAGVPPFDLEELRSAGYHTVVRKLCEEDPPRPSTRVSSRAEDSTAAACARRTEVPALIRALLGDLDWIVMKALEKDPDRRYGSPAELAADVARHLGDEPVLARPPSVGYRLGKLLRRHFFGVSARRRPLPAFALLAMSAVIVALLIWGGLGRWRAGRQAELAQRLGKEVRDFEWLIRVAQMSPLHAIEDDRRRVHERMDAVRQMMLEIGELARGPGHYALGRGHLAVGDQVAAIDHFEQAWQAGYRNAESAAGLGLALGETYRSELIKARQIASAAAATDRVREIETRYRDRAIDLLRRRRPESFIAEDYALALLAFYQGDVDQAAAKAEQAVAAKPWLFEAHLLQGDAYFERAITGWSTGDLEAAGADAARADRGYARAAEIAASSVEAHLGRCGVAGLLLHMALHDFEWDVDATWGVAEKACADALVVDPENAEAHRQHSVVLVSWGAFVLRRGGDPSVFYQRAADHSEAAIDLAGGGAENFIELAGIYRMRANWARRTGSDPRPHLARAEAVYQLALDSEPRSSTALNNQALVWRDLATYEIDQGLDARVALERAVVSLLEALRLEPGKALPYNNLASQAAARAEEQGRRGVDPCGDLNDVLRFLGQLPRRDDIPQQAEAEDQLRQLVRSAC